MFQNRCSTIYLEGECKVMKEAFLSTNACPEDLTHWYFHGSKIGMNHLLVSNVLEIARSIRARRIRSILYSLLSSASFGRQYKPSRGTQILTIVYNDTNCERNVGLIFFCQQCGLPARKSRDDHFKHAALNS